MQDFHRFDTSQGAHLLIADGSRIYDLSTDAAALFDDAREDELSALLTRLGIDSAPVMRVKRLDKPPSLRSVSLAVAQSCNLGCGYCYAQQGGFGAPPAAMAWEVARSALDRLIDDVPPGGRVQVAFLGGEPLANRALLQRATAYAVERARALGANVAFAITTNGTLLRPEDADFFAKYRFAVTVSLDGGQALHDALRPFKNGDGSYRRILQNLQSFFGRPDVELAARVTVTPRNLDLSFILQDLIEAGFRSVGFSPMLRSPNGAGELQSDDLRILLAQMIGCGEVFLHNALQGTVLPFENMRSALQEIHRGTHRPYPCGAGAGYMGVAADGGLFACHRFVADPAGEMGSVQAGLDTAAQRRWLAERAVDAQSPCNACWARYLCGGGCHHEVIHRGRPACDYIRGWLDFCLRAYAELLAVNPAYFEPAP